MIRLNTAIRTYFVTLSGKWTQILILRYWSGFLYSGICACMAYVFLQACIFTGFHHNIVSFMPVSFWHLRIPPSTLLRWPSPNCVLQGTRKGFILSPLWVAITALPAFLLCEFWAVFSLLVSAVRITALYEAAVVLKHAVWRRLLWDLHGIVEKFPYSTWT